MIREFKSGQRVRVKQKAPITYDGLVLDSNVFEGVTITRRNEDGTYQVRGILKTPESDEVKIPADWIEAL